jgi:hypothetical protein
MKIKYDNERASIIKAYAMRWRTCAGNRKGRETNGFTAQYRALSKTYNNVPTLFEPCQEVEAKRARLTRSKILNHRPYDEDARDVVI